MKLPRRTPTPEVVRAVALLPGERRLAWAVTAAGQPLVATPTRLLLPTGPLDWVGVERASWKPPLLVVTEVAEVEGAGRQHQLVLAEQGSFVEVVRARVTSSVAWSDRRRLQPTGTVRLVGRRVPGEDALVWQLAYDADADLSDPLVHAQAAAHVEAVRRTIG